MGAPNAGKIVAYDAEGNEVHIDPPTPVTLGEIRERFRVIGSAAASTAGGLGILERRVVELESAVADLRTYAQRELELQTGLLGIQEQLVSRMKTLERRMAGKRAEPK